MILYCVSSCTEPRIVRRQLPISSPLGPSRPPRHPILRHGDRKLVVVTLLDSAFTKRHTRNSFRMCIYENCRGVPTFFPNWNRSNRHVARPEVDATAPGGGQRHEMGSWRLLGEDDGGAAVETQGAGGVAFVHRDLDEAAGAQIGKRLRAVALRKGFDKLAHCLGSG